MKKNDLDEKISEIIREDQRYPADAYKFVNHTVMLITSRHSKKRHITALELLKGIRVTARESFGPFAAQVLMEWGVQRPGDIGAIVNNLVAAKVLSASKDDSPEDFAIDFDLFDGLEPEESITDVSNLEVPVID